MAPTARGVGTALAGAALIASGFTFGYPELVVIGVAGVVALLCAVGYTAWRLRLTVHREVNPARVTRGQPCTQTLSVRNSCRLRVVTLIAQDVCG